MAAVVVTDSLDWKLHGFDLLSEHALTGAADCGFFFVARVQRRCSVSLLHLSVVQLPMRCS
jgi:hypothetical protein